MDKQTLRNNLFEKYFEVEDGVLAVDLVDKLSFIPELWEKLHVMCENNIRYFDSYSTLRKIKTVEYKQRKYLILKLRMFAYVIIDLEKTENITKNQFINEFDEDFFINNFGEVKSEDGENLLFMYSIYRYDGNIQELVDFYTENQDILCMSGKLYYKLEIGDAWTYFSIDFVNAKAQMGFLTPDQFLYEQLFLRYDLTPSRSQDAQQKIGIDRMREMFERIKDLKIPRQVIPNDLYQQFLLKSSTKIHKLEK